MLEGRYLRGPEPVSQPAGPACPAARIRPHLDRPLQPALLVFSDLDGTLLDHETYSHAAARPALDALRAARLPLILASSKTAREIAALRADLGFEHCPAIVENGAGLLAAGPFDATLAQRDTYDALRAILARLDPELRRDFEGFGDWDPAEIARRTGLRTSEARMAANRQFSEPGIWSGSAAGLAAFLAALGAEGIQARRGGRFLTLSFGASKADRMDEVLALYRSGNGPPPVTLALGDAPNDVEMLERAERGVIVANPSGTPVPPLPGERTGAIRRAVRAGPAGWNEEVLALLSDLGAFPA